MNKSNTLNASDINSCLCLASKRLNGLIQLSEYLNKCTNHTIEEYGLFWLKTLLQIIENHPITLHAKLAHYCLYLLINHSRANNELSKSISTSFIDKIINILTSSSEPLTKNSLICLNELIKWYRGGCSQYKQKLEAFIITNLDSDSNEISEWASKCYSKLPTLYKSTNNSNNNNNDIWTNYFNNVFSHAHQLLDLIFEDFTSGTKSHSNEREQLLPTSIIQQIFKQNLTKESTTLDSYYKKLSKRFQVCCKCMSYLFNLADGLQARIPINLINAFLMRLYYYDFDTLINNAFLRANNEYIHFISNLKHVYSTILEFSKLYFNYLNTNLIPKSDTINQFIINYGNYVTNEIFSDTLPLYYEMIYEWIESLGVNCSFYKFDGTSFIDNLLANLKPKIQLVALDIKHDERQNANKKHIIEQQKKLFASNKNNKSKLNNNISNYNNEKVAYCSLKCLKQLIKYFNHQFNYNDLTKIQRTIVNIMLNVQHDYKYKEIYNQDECRLCLYQTLFELCLSKNLRVAPPFSISINIFDNAKFDHSIEIRAFSHQSLSSLRSFISPILPITVVQYDDQSKSHLNRLTSNGILNYGYDNNKQQQQQSESNSQQESSDNQEMAFNDQLMNGNVGSEVQIETNNGISNSNEKINANISKNIADLEEGEDEEGDDYVDDDEDEEEDDDYDEEDDETEKIRVNHNKASNNKEVLLNNKNNQIIVASNDVKVKNGKAVNNEEKYEDERMEHDYENDEDEVDEEDFDDEDEEEEDEEVEEDDYDDENGEYDEEDDEDIEEVVLEDDEEEEEEEEEEKKNDKKEPEVKKNEKIVNENCEATEHKKSSPNHMNGSPKIANVVDSTNEGIENNNNIEQVNGNTLTSTTNEASSSNNDKIKLPLKQLVSYDQDQVNEDSEKLNFKENIVDKLAANKINNDNNKEETKEDVDPNLQEIMNTLNTDALVD